MFKLMGKKIITILSLKILLNWLTAMKNCSVVEYLTRARGVVSSSLTRGTSRVVSLSKTLYPLLSTGSTQEDHPYMTEKLSTGM